VTVTTEGRSSGFSLKASLPSILVNAVAPLAIYSLAKQYATDSEIVALGLAAILPAVGSVLGLLRRRSIDAIGALALLGIAVSLFGLLVSGDARLLLVRESFVTGTLGLACFVSLLLPRPLMFYFGRQFMAGNDPVRLAGYNERASHPDALRVHRTITIVWGFATLGEFAIRLAIVLSLPIPVAVGIVPMLGIAVTLSTLAWTFAYVRRQERQANAN
jgi:hypothetical protein